MANIKSLSFLIVLMLFIIAAAVPIASAMNIDNSQNSKNINSGESFSIGNKNIEYNPIWETYKPIEIKNMFGWGKTLFRGAITQHDDVCGIDCSSTMQIYLSEDSVLIDDVDFYTIKDDGSQIKQDVRSYQFYVSSIDDSTLQGNEADGETYSLGTEMPAGNYKVKLNAEKKPSRTVDWVIKTNGETLNEWATWGNISLGDDGEVILINPSDNYTLHTLESTFNCSANITGGAELTNISLFDDSTGTWGIRDTQSISKTLYNPDSNVNTSNAFDEDYDTYAAKLIWSSGTTDNHDNELGQIFGIRKVGTVNYKSQFAWGLGSMDTSSIVITLESYNGTEWAVEATNNTAVPSLLVNRSVVLDKYVEGLMIKTVVSYSHSGSFTGFASTFKTYELNYNTLQMNYTNSFTQTISGTTNWNCQACDSDEDCGFATENRTVYLDTNTPIINITYPTTSFDYAYTGQNISLNWTSSDTSLESCWYNYNNTNTTVTCADLNASFILTDQKNVTFYANDSAANEANFTRSWTYKIFGNSEKYNLTTYETAREGFRINLTANGSQSITASLYYGGTYPTGGIYYDTTKTGNNSEMVFSRDIIVPAISTATAINNTFFWTISYGAEDIDTPQINQSTGRIALGLCNTTLTAPYINFTFEDEETTIATNASIDTSTWTYYLSSGDATINKTLLYSTTDANESYGFCFLPSDKTITSSLELQYSDTGYPQRRWSTSGDLTNTTSTPTLYMLASADGTYSVYQVQDTVGNGIEGVEVVVKREFAGVWTLVEQGVTDSAGGFTGWLNPDYDHELTFTKSGYSTVTVTVRPSSSTYTVVMGSGASAATYNSSTEGLFWTVYPDLGKIILPNTTQTFLFNITANLSNIVSCKMELVNNNTVSLGSTIGCDSKGGNLSLSIPVGTNRSIRAIYYVDMGEGYIILDADAYWSVMTTNIPNRGTLVSFFKYARELNEFGNDSNRQEFSRIVFFFLMLSIVMGYISYSTGWDFSTAGGAIGFMTFIIIFASYGGFLRISYTGTNAWMDQYVVALITSLFAAGYILNKFARET